MSLRPRIVAVGGFSSNCGKTSIVCRLLEAWSGWEAIKVTKGHFRSCGKDPHSCCVSGLLEDAPIVRSGRDANCEPGKDTGRFWEAGASNVHWVIAAKGDVEEGLAAALRLVSPQAAGVLVEGTSVIRSMESDFAIVCATADQSEVKPSAVSILPYADAIFVFGSRRPSDPAAVERRLVSLARGRRFEGSLPELYFEDEFDRLLDRAAIRFTAPRKQAEAPVAG